jgi:hypothetical protein
MLTTTDVESTGRGKDKWYKEVERDVHFCRWSAKDMKSVTCGELLDEHCLPNIAVGKG